MGMPRFMFGRLTAPAGANKEVSPTEIDPPTFPPPGIYVAYDATIERLTQLLPVRRSVAEVKPETRREPYSFD